MELLSLHVITAIASLIITGAAFVFPSKTVLRVSYAFVSLTLITGTYLVVSAHTPIISACTTGLVYLGLVGVGIVSTRRKLALSKILISE